jgi:SAM-dependent methyltransferase
MRAIDIAGQAMERRMADGPGSRQAATTTTREILSTVASYYSGKLEQHGETPKGVDWRDERAQEERFAHLSAVWREPNDLTGSIADLGCGYGSYLGYLRVNGFTGAYSGFDVSQAMIDSARKRFAGDPAAEFVLGNALDVPVDYVVASGIFNVRLTTPVPDWERYIFETIDAMQRVSRKGFAFNCLTNKVTYRRDDLYYGDPQFWLDHCRREGSVPALREDASLFDFTIIVRKTSG